VNAKSRSSMTESVVASCLSYELSMTDDEDSLVPDHDDDEDSIFSLDIPTNNDLLSGDDFAHLKVEVEALANEKSLMKDSLLELSDQIELKRSELEKVDEDLTERQLDFQAELEREKAHRDELASEVLQLNHQLKTLVNRAENNKGSTAERQAMQIAQDLGKSLGEERTRCEELQTKCNDLQHNLTVYQESNSKLARRNGGLLKEIASLKQKLRMTNPDISESCFSHTEPETENTDDDVLFSHTLQLDTDKKETIVSRAEQILRMVDDGGFDDEAGGLRSVCDSSAMSSMCTTNTLNITDGDDARNSNGREFGTIVISNIDEAGKCRCEESMFGGNAEHVEFYLPQLGVSCTCGRSNAVASTAEFFVKTSDMYALGNILRPWQVEFLASRGIHGAVEFVHIFKQRGHLLAKDLRRWRKEKRLPTVRTKACRVALHIWHRTCKSVIKYAREQEMRGTQKPQKPDFLQVSFTGDMNSVSTLGIGSVFNEMEATGTLEAE